MLSMKPNYKEEINKMKKALSLVLMIVLIVALAVPAASAADDTIKIGYIGDLSQSTALWGNAGKFGALEAIEEIKSSLKSAPTSLPATSRWLLLRTS